MNPKTILKLIFLLIVLLSGFHFLKAQQPIWGFAPELHPSIQGNVLNYSAIDYRTGISHLDAHSSISNYKNDQGVVAWKISNGVTGFSSYDINLQQFVTDYMSSGGSFYELSDGIVTCYQGASFVAAIYDPILQAWQKTVLSVSSPFGTLNDKGIVSWKNSNNELSAAVYDPFIGNWMTKSLTLQTWGTWKHHAGMISWIGQENNFGSALYDFETHAWRIETHSTDNAPEMDASAGVVAWADHQNNAHASIYDIDLDAWVHFQFPSTNIHSDISVSGGTVYFQEHTGEIRRWGYDTDTKTWIQNTFTKPSCKIITYQPNAVSPSTIFTTSKFVGASSCDYAFGDQSYSTRQMSYKQYEFGGTFEIKNRLSQLGLVRECVTPVTVSGPTHVDLTSNSEVAYGPNPINSHQTTLRIKTEKPCRQVRIISIDQKVVLSQAVSGKAVELDLSQHRLNAGIYLVEIEFRDNETVRNRLIVLD